MWNVRSLGALRFNATYIVVVFFQGHKYYTISDKFNCLE